MSARPFHFLILGLAIAVLLWATLVYSQSGEAVPNSDTGRFQLFEGRYEAILTEPGQAQLFDHVGLFKIDTRTGETWIFMTVVRDDGYTEFWFPIPTKDSKKIEGQ